MKPWRILIVDDDELILAMSRVAVRRLGHEAVTCADASSALERVREAPDAYSLVLCDVRLGTENGFELAQAIRGLAPAAPVVMLSGAVEPGDAERAASLGVLALLPKSQVMTDLGGTLRRFLPS